jgi:hypothetical protein
LTLALLLLLAACGGGTVGGEAAATSAIRLHVTDAPFPSSYVESASVVIREVRVRSADGGWNTAFEGFEEIDLVPLTGGVTTLLASIDLPTGTYDQVRLVVDAGRVVLSPDAAVAGDSHVFSSANGGLEFPSGAQTGIQVKVDAPVEVEEGLSADLVLDFDLSRNFVFNGPPEHAPGVRRVLFTPVVRAVNRTTSGRIVVDVRTDAGASADEPLPGATVTATDLDGAEAAGAVADADGRAVLVLLPGSYEIEIAAPGHEAVTVPSVAVTRGNVTTIPAVTLHGMAVSVGGTVLGDAGTAGDPSDDLPLEGATVSATLEGEAAPAATTTTDASGAWSLQGLAPGTYDVAFDAPGHVATSLLGVVPTAGGATADVTLAATP